MRADVAEKWIAALRSGKYVQATSALRNQMMRDDGVVTTGYCCLGVLCDVVRHEYPTDFVSPIDFTRTSLPAAVVTFTGMHTPWGMIPGAIASLAYMNDTGTPFSEIANYIEQHQEQL